MATINEPMAKRDPSDFENILVQMREHLNDSELISNELYALAEALECEDKLKAEPEPDPSMLRGGIIPEIAYLMHKLTQVNGRNRNVLQRLRKMI